MAAKGGEEKMHEKERHMLALNGEDIDEKDVPTGTSSAQLAMSPQKSKKKRRRRRKKKKKADTMTAEEVYKERYGKERSDQGHGGFFACGVYGCNYIGKTYAHLSLHCALSHFCSHYDIPITSIRASDPTELQNITPTAAR